MKPQLNKWVYGIEVTRDSMRLEPWSKEFHIWCYKLHTMPEIGVRFDSRYYKGFKWGFRFWFPIERL